MVGQAANGVEQINIAAPNAKGLSHNLYQSFNVSKQGVILNNATSLSKTELGGYVQANPHLSQGAASLILNEVTSRNPSVLNGYMEVAGKQAGVVVANPNGITCDGCGFINTSRGTFTTGKPQLNASGALQGFDVQGGQITFNGQGINAKKLDQFDVISRAVKINANVYADRLNLVAGKQQVDYTTLATHNGATDADAPAISIDSSALGGIYANRISLVSTEQGVGVHLDAPVAALTGNVSLSADGKLTYAGISAKTDIVLKAADLLGEGQVVAGRNFSAAGDNLIQEEGGITANNVAVSMAQIVEVSDGARLSAVDELEISATNLNNHGVLSGKQVNISVAQTVNNNGGKLVASGGHSQSLVLSADVLTNHNGNIALAGESQTLSVAHLELGNGNVQHTGAGVLFLEGESLSLMESKLASNGDISLRSRSAIQAANSQLASKNKLSLVAQDGVTLTGVKLDAGGLVVDSAATVMLDDQTAVTIAGEGVFKAVEVEHLQDAQLAIGHLVVNVVNDLLFTKNVTWRGDASLTTQGVLRIDAAQINLPGKLIVSAGSMTLTSSETSQAGVTAGSMGIELAGGYSSTNSSSQRSALIAHDLSLSAHNISNAGDMVVLGDPSSENTPLGNLVLKATGNVDNYGLIFSKGGIGVHVAGALQNGDASHYDAGIMSFGELVIDGLNSIENIIINTASLIQSEGNMTLKAKIIKNDREGETFYQTKTKKDYRSDVTYGDIDESWKEVAENFVGEEGVPGRIFSAKGINLIASDILNINSIISVGGEATINGNLRNKGTELLIEITQHVRDWDRDSGPLCDGGWSSCYDLELDWKKTEIHQKEVLPAVLAVAGSLTLNGNVENVSEIPGGTADTDSLEDFPFQQMPQFETSPIKPDVFVQGNIIIGETITSDDIARLKDSVLFQINLDPGYPYLIESRYQYADLDGFKGSEYMLEQLGWAPDGATKLLGDGFAELTMVRQQLIAMAGATFGLDTKKLIQQYANWVNNGLYASEALQLTPGISLTAEQVNALTQDIVWPIKKIVAGVSVMIPTIYLASADLSSVKNGSIIAADSIRATGDDFVNNGVITAKRAIDIDSKEVKLSGKMGAGNNIDIDAKVIDILSGKISGDNISLSATDDIKIATASMYTENRGAGSHTWNTQLGEQASLDARDKLNVSAGNDVAINGANLKGQQVSLDAGHDLTLGTVVDREGHDIGSDGYRDTRDKVRNIVTEITSTLDTLMQADNDITLLGSDVNAGGNLQLAAKGDITVANVTDSDYHYHQETDSKWYGSKTTTTTDYDEKVVGPNLSAGGDVLINTHKDADGSIVTNDDAKGDVTLVSANVHSGGDTAVYAGGDLTVGIATETHYHASETTRSYSGLAKGAMAAVAVAGSLGVLPPVMTAAGMSKGVTIKGNAGEGNSKQTVVASTLKADGDTVLLSGKDITLVTPDLSMDNLTAKAGLDKEAGGGSIWLTGAHDTSESWSYESSTSLGIKASGGSLSFARQQEHREQDSQSKFVGTKINSLGDTSLAGTGDVTLLGSSINSKGKVSIDAGGDVNMLAAVDTSHHEVSDAERDFKLAATASGHSAELFAGYEENRHTESHTTRTAVGSSIGAVNINVTSGNDINVVGSNLTATYDPDATKEDKVTLPNGKEVAVAYNDTGNITLNAKRDINTLASVSADTLKTIDEHFRTGLAIGAKENVSAAADAVGNVKGQQGGVNTGSAVLQAVDAMQGARGGASFSVGLVAEWSKTESEDSSQTSDISVIHADNDLAFISGGDQHHQGTEAKAGNNLTVDAGGKVLIESAQNTSGHKDKSANGSANVGLSTGSGISVTAAGGYARNSNEQTQQVNAHFEAGKQVSLTTAGDTTLAGATVTGDSIDAHIGGNLTVESRQDTGSIRGESAQGSVTVSVSGGGSGLTLAGSHTEGDSAWVEEQSGLFATGKNNVYVENHTSLIGGVINSDSGELTLDTGSLSHEDIHDYDHFKSVSASVGIGTSQSNGGAPADTANEESQSGAKMNSLQVGYQKRDREQITRATVGQGTITVRDDAANGTDSTQGLNRDIDRAQEITKDEDHSTNLYASDTSLKGIGAIKENDDSSRLQQLKDTLNPGLAISEIVEGGVASIDGLDNALATGLTLGQARPNANGSMGLLNDRDIANVAGKVGDGVLAISDAVVNKDHDGNWHLFDLGTTTTAKDHYTRNQDARLKQEAIRQALAASKSGKLGEQDLVDLVNNLTDHDAAQSEKVLSYIASQIAEGKLDVGFYDDGAGLAAFGEAFSNSKEHVAGLNASELNLRDPRAYMSALAEEGYHSREAGDDSYANLYGNRFGYLWDKTNKQEGRATGGSVTQADWMTQNRSTLATNNATYRQYGLGDIEFRQLADQEIIILKTSPLVDAFAQDHDMTHDQALTMLGRNLAGRVGADWANEAHIQAAYDPAAQDVLDQLAAIGFKGDDGHLLFQREKDVDPAAYYNDLMYADGLNERIVRDGSGRSMFYANHVVAASVKDDLYHWYDPGGAFAQGEAAGTDAYIDDTITGIQQGLASPFTHPVDTALAVGKYALYQMVPGLAATNAVITAPDVYNDIRDSYTDWRTADERTALAAFHGNYQQAGYIGAGNTATNVGLAISLAGGLEGLAGLGMRSGLSFAMPDLADARYLTALEAKIANRTATKAEWKLYSQEIRASGLSLDNILEVDANFLEGFASREWPPNAGFLGDSSKLTLEPGAIIDRYGGYRGTYAAPDGTGYRARALKPGTDRAPFRSFEVLKPIEVDAGLVRSWFGYEGLGTQYKLPRSVLDLMDSGHLRKIDNYEN